VRRLPPSPPRRGARRRTTKRRLIVPWSGIDIVTEYPVGSSSDDSGSDGPDEPSYRNSRPSAACSLGGDGAATASSLDGGASHMPAGPGPEVAPPPDVVLQDPWCLSGPLDQMTGLPIAVSKQTAVLLHACKWTPPVRQSATDR